VNSVVDQFRLLRPGWRDVLEIAIASYAIYRLLLVLHRRRAMQILIGIVVLIVTYAVAKILQLTMITYLMSQVFTYAALALVVVFAPELRAVLAQIGRSPLAQVFGRVDPTAVAHEVSDAVERLSRNGIGAIIAIEREVSLQEYLQTGSQMQAKVSADLIATIFTPYSPLHDGAIVIRGDTIVGAGCILPLSQSPITDRSLGTRHLAALGLTEDTDAIVVVVSEETSTISAAVGAKLWRSLTIAQLREILAGESPRQIADDTRTPTTA
jgi:diadenylate cyclase